MSQGLLDLHLSPPQPYVVRERYKWLLETIPIVHHNKIFNRPALLETDMTSHQDSAGKLQPVQHLITIKELKDTQ